VELSSIGPALAGGAQIRAGGAQVEAGGLSPPELPLTLTTAYTSLDKGYHA